MERLRRDAEEIIRASIEAVMPGEAVRRALLGHRRAEGRSVLVAAGKAAWSMASAAAELIDADEGIVITKYGHVMGELPGIECIEAGHPVPDENGFKAADKALGLVSGLGSKDEVIFLLSGGASALFEKPLISGEELKNITEQLLSSGADIREINTIRKRLSAVKGGRFALACSPARVFSIVLSDVAGDSLDTIASGPAYPDSSTCADAARVAEKYGLKLSGEAREHLGIETPKELDNVTTVVTGSVSELCKAAKAKCSELGYRGEILTDRLDGEARDAGEWLGSLAAENAAADLPIALIAGGETVVKLKGSGKGGRAQELALAAAPHIRGLDAAVFCFGSDGSDGPTDAAGGFVDGGSMDSLEGAGIDAAEALDNNDSYNALKACGGLIITGPTGTNVNDAAIVLTGSPRNREKSKGEDLINGK